MLRWMAGFGLVTVGHLILSGFGVLLAVAAAMSSGGSWLITAMFWCLFFPALAALEMGADLDFIADLPARWVFAAFVANSLCWTSLVYPVCAGLRDWAQSRRSRAESIRRRKEEAAWWADFFNALSSESQGHAEPDAAPDRRPDGDTMSPVHPTAGR